MTEIVVLDYSTGEVTFTKVSDEVLKKYNDDVECYLSRHLGFRIDDIHYMCGAEIKVLKI